MSSILNLYVTRHDIVFFERNGLRHGEFGLPHGDSSGNCVVKELDWNCDSSILAVSLTFFVNGIEVNGKGTN